MASSALLPFNVNKYASILDMEYRRFAKSYEEKFKVFGVPLVNLENAIRNFTVNSNRFMKRVKRVNLNE